MWKETSMELSAKCVYILGGHPIYITDSYITDYMTGREGSNVPFQLVCKLPGLNYRTAVLLELWSFPWRRPQPCLLWLFSCFPAVFFWMLTAIHIKNKHTSKSKKIIPKGFRIKLFKVLIIHINQKTDEAVPTLKNHADYMM